MAELVLLTGFLGSGKTTLLKELLTAFERKKIGVVINEFGETGIDGRLVSYENFDMVEINNGSVFCSCLKDKFIEALIEMTKYDLDYIFVESTGLADPSNMDSISEILSKQSESQYSYKGSICIIDAEYFEDLFDLLPAIERQILYSDLMIINKADTRSKEELKTIEEKVKGLNQKAPIVTTTYCQADYLDLLEQLSPNDHVKKESVNTPESRLKTIRLAVSDNYKRIQIEKFLHEICPSTYRIKGFMNLDGEICEISVVNCSISIKELKDQKPIAELILISSIGITLISKITETWKNHVGEPLKFI